MILKKKWLDIRVTEKRQLLIKEAKEDIIVKVLRNDKWQIEDDLMLMKEKIYVLKNKFEAGNYLAML